MTDTDAQLLTGVSETMLVTLYIRAMESQRPDALIHDEQAVALMRRIGGEFSFAKQVPMTESARITIIMRNQEFDRCARDFLVRHPQAAVVHIGCGLDPRFDRVDNGQVEWYDLDLPEVIDVRRRLLGGESGRHHLLGCSVLESSWMGTVAAPGSRPVLFLVEGVFMYFDEAQVKALVPALRRRFPGAELVFDIFSPLHVWFSNLRVTLSRSRFPRLDWGIWHGQELERWCDGIFLLDEWSFWDRPEPRLDYVRWVEPLDRVIRTLRIYHFRLGGPEGGPAWGG